MCDKKFYNLLKTFGIPQHHLRFGTLKVEGGQGDKKIVRTSGNILATSLEWVEK